MQDHMPWSAESRDFSLRGSREGNIKLYTQVINTNLLLWSIRHFNTHTAELCTMFGTNQQFTAYFITDMGADATNIYTMKQL